MTRESRRSTMPSVLATTTSCDSWWSTAVTSMPRTVMAGECRDSSTQQGRKNVITEFITLYGDENPSVVWNLISAKSTPSKHGIF